MRRWLPLACAALLALGLAGAPRAQDAPPLRVTARLPAGAQAQAGATLRLELDVMTTTWFTQPPRLPALTLPGVMVTPPSGEGELVRAEHNGVAYSGLRYTYLLSPTAAGQVQVPALAVSAEVGPGKTPASASSAPLSFTVGGAAGGQPAPHGALTVSQDFALAPDPLVAGGRVTRSITQRAEGVQAMLLPPAPLADVPGFKRYAREPEVTTLTDGRGGFVGGQRIDRADYVAEQAGELSLPAVTLAWRDGAGGQPRQQALPGRTFAVAAAPAVAPPFSLTDDLARLRHGLRWVLPAAWLAWAAGGALALLALWLGWPWWRQGLCRLRPACMRLPQKAQVVQRMDRADRAGPGVGRFAHVELQLARGLGQGVQARRHFLGRAHLAAREIGLRVVQLLVGMVEGFHVMRSAAGPSPHRCDGWPGRLPKSSTAARCR
ncbi:BatD family protein [Bordetella bronchiseptica]|uniref:BatD family protein n=1 Tax=Bordetella bronchiseptica TaxID=518 RepID=UPI0012D2E106